MANKKTSKGSSSALLSWNHLKLQSSKLSAQDLKRTQREAEARITIEGTPLNHQSRDKISLVPDPNRPDHQLEITRSELLSARGLPDLGPPWPRIPRVSVTLRSDTASLGQFSKDFVAGAQAGPPIGDVTVDPGQCVLWRQGPVQNRIILALAEWGQVPPQTLRQTITLGQLAKGTPWGPGQQVELVQITNAHQVFSPFPSIMQGPPLLNSDTPLSDWVKVVWAMQSPRTPCWGI